MSRLPVQTKGIDDLDRSVEAFVLEVLGGEARETAAIE
jgi:hypothetical protein